MFLGIHINHWYTEAGIWEEIKPNTITPPIHSKREVSHFEDLDYSSWTPDKIEKLTSRLKAIITSDFYSYEFSSIGLILPWDWKPWYLQIKQSIKSSLPKKDVTLISEPLAQIAFFYSISHENTTPLILDLNASQLSLIEIPKEEKSLFVDQAQVFEFPQTNGSRVDLLKEILNRTSDLSKIDLSTAVNVLANFLDMPFMAEKLQTLTKTRYDLDPKSEYQRIITEIADSPILLGYLIESENAFSTELSTTLSTIKKDYLDDSKTLLLSGEFSNHLQLQSKLIQALNHKTIRKNYSIFHGAAIIATKQLETKAHFEYALSIAVNNIEFNSLTKEYHSQEKYLPLASDEQNGINKETINYYDYVFQFSKEKSTVKIRSYLINDPSTEKEVLIPIQIPKNHLQHRFHLILEIKDRHRCSFIFESLVNQHQVKHHINLS